MSVTKPVRCLLVAASKSPYRLSASSAGALQAQCIRQLHSSSARDARRRPHYPSIKQSDLQALTEESSEAYPKYSTSDESLLAKQYTPSQIAAIRAAEESIDPKDLHLQHAMRTDPMRIQYEDEDFSMIHPVLDKQPKKPLDPNVPYHSFRPKDEEELIDGYVNFIVKMGQKYVSSIDHWEQVGDEFEVDMTRFLDDPRTYMRADSEEVFKAFEDPAYSALAPELPRLRSPLVQSTINLGEEEDVHQNRLMKQMGWDRIRVQKVQTKVLHQRFVSNQTRMGKIRSQYYLTIAGTGNGLLGVGEGKSTEAEDGMRQSMMAASRNMKPIHRYEKRTIYGEVKAKVGAVEVVLSARPPGFGNRAQHLIFEMARMAGIQDLAAHLPRARNKMNVVKATWEALQSQRLPEDVARARGRKLVDVRKVYYGGTVY